MLQNHNNYLYLYPHYTYDRRIERELIFTVFPRNYVKRYKNIKDGGPTTGARELAQEAHEEKAAQLPRAPKAAPILCCFHNLSL